MKSTAPQIDADSGWYDSMPSHWRLARLDHVATSWPSNVDKHTNPDETPIRLCNYTDVYKNDVIVNDMEFMRATATPEQIERFRLDVGDTIVTKDSETADDIGIPAYVAQCAPDLICGYHLSIVRPMVDAIVPRFLFWVLGSQPVLGQWAVLASGVTRVGIRAGDLAKAALLLPPVDEQRVIADFLDRETARIDTLIEEQQRLINLLQERRADLIRVAVLGTMNPLSLTAADQTSAIGHHFSVTLGKMLDGGKSSRDGDESLPYVRAGNLQDDGLHLDNVNMMPFSPRERRDLDLRAGDLLVAEGGAVGTNVVLTDDMPGWSFQKTVNRVRPLRDWSTAWLGYVVLTYRDLGVIDIVCNRSTIAHLTAEKLRALKVPCCDAIQQRRIAGYLDEQTTKIDTLIAETERFIELSRERRSALITAAVTGQINVHYEVA